eukprot:GEMP01024951.1.p1 GENE.GEMP01024951.1~~GEMP01024951.1.p1  ORF type:complete len:616 (+),score=130.34 GEMP01024951.1:193-1848(+)
MRVGFVSVKTDAKVELALKNLGTENNIATYRVAGQQGIAPGESLRVTISALIGNPYSPSPKTKTLFAQQFMKFSDSLRICSPYKVKDQITLIKTADVSQDMQASPVKVVPKTAVPETSSDVGGALAYGPFNNVEPFSTAERFSLLVSNDNHCAYFTKIQRDIEVSHWGNVAVVERFELKHGGAALEGDFNRVPFMWRNQASGKFVQTALTELKAILPRSARQIDYRDFIGNISSSWARKDSAGFVSVELKPRYPIVGGWKAHWELWYNLPLKNVLHRDADKPDHYVLNVSFAHPFAGMYAQKIETRVMLPEGAHSIQMLAPRQPDTQITRAWSWMDYTSEGRPVLEFTVNNFIIPERFQLNHKFQVMYVFSSMHMVREPLFLSLFIFALFFTYLIGTRSRLRIVRPGQAKVMDEIEHNKKIVEYFIDAYDDLWNHFRSMTKSGEDFAKKPVGHKWKAYIDKSKSHSTRLATRLEKIAATHTKDTLKKMMAKIRELMEAEHSRITLVGGGSTSNETDRQIREWSTKATRLEEDVITTLQAASDDAAKSGKQN